MSAGEVRVGQGPVGGGGGEEDRQREQKKCYRARLWSFDLFIAVVWSHWWGSKQRNDLIRSVF